MEKIKANREHKDRLFKKIFSDKEALLELYNAVNGTEYTNAEDIEVDTIEDFRYMGMKNDVSFLFGESLNLYEQQSTINPNMALRGFFYLAMLYRKMFGEDADLYSSRRIALPAPQFIIFYNGTAELPDVQEIRMSDAFATPTKYPPSVECRAQLLNINYGHNRKLMERCRKIRDYAILIKKILT